MVTTWGTCMLLNVEINGSSEHFLATNEQGGTLVYVRAPEINDQDNFTNEQDCLDYVRNAPNQSSPLRK